MAFALYLCGCGEWYISSYCYNEITCLECGRKIKPEEGVIK